jgi:hypothetical protein
MGISWEFVHDEIGMESSVPSNLAKSWGNPLTGDI